MTVNRNKEIDKEIDAVIHATEELKTAMQRLAVKSCLSPTPNPFEYLIRFYELTMMTTSKINTDIIEATQKAEKNLKSSFESGTFKDVMQTDDFKRFEKDWRENFDRR